MPDINKDKRVKVYLDSSYLLHKQYSKPDIKSPLGHSQSYNSIILDTQQHTNDARRSVDVRRNNKKLLITEDERGLLKAKQGKHQSMKEVYAMQSKILKLKMEEERMLRKIDNERRKAEELQKVRQSYDEKMMQLKIASFEREQK